MKPDPIDETQVVQAATVVGLEIPHGRVAGVTATLNNIANIALVLNEIELTAADEPAPVWIP